MDRENGNFIPTLSQRDPRAAGVPTPVLTPTPVPSVPTKKNRLPLIIGILTVLVLGVVGVGVYFLFDWTISGTVRPAEVVFNAEDWHYDSEHHVYYQLGVDYVANPASNEHESLSIYVPGDYLSCDANQSADTCSCKLDGSQSVNDYTATSAPIVLPVGTSDYAAQTAPTSYDYQTVSDYLEKGMVYLYAGYRGLAAPDTPSGDEDSSIEPSADAPISTSFPTSAPWGVTDLKAAVRFVRYYDKLIPGDKSAIYAFGQGSGGAQAAILGTSGDSTLYTPYLETIGAIMTDSDGHPLSDAISGVNAWCPITELGVADAAYEWDMGQFSDSGTRANENWTKAFSKDLAAAYAEYVNKTGFTADGATLSLNNDGDSIYLGGSYYDYVLGIISRSLNHYLEDHYPEIPARAAYVASLGDWVSFDAESGTATVTSLAGFVQSQKPATKNVGAFDGLFRQQPENAIFADDDNHALHFSDMMSTLLAARDYNGFQSHDINTAQEYRNDLTTANSFGHKVAQRLSMYTPTDYLIGGNEAISAPHWRIRTGIMQSETALTTEINLALALGMNDEVKDVDFETIWATGHTEAERVGAPADNFIAWIESLTK